MDLEFKITGIMFHENTAIVSRETIGGFAGGNAGGRKDLSIYEFSAKARAELAFTVCETQVKFKTFITLTYPAQFPQSGKQVKRDLNLFLTKLRQQYKKVDYLWFFEFQNRGAPHFHILTTIAATKINEQKIAILWANTVKTDWQKVYNFHRGFYKNRPALEAIKKQDGAKRYALKYALKTYQKAVPANFTDVGRFWGTSRNVKKNISSVKNAILFDNDLTEAQKLDKINELCGTNFPEFAPKMVFLRKKD